MFLDLNCAHATQQKFCPQTRNILPTRHTSWFCPFPMHNGHRYTQTSDTDQRKIIKHYLTIFSQFFSVCPCLSYYIIMYSALILHGIYCSMFWELCGLWFWITDHKSVNYIELKYLHVLSVRMVRVHSKIKKVINTYFSLVKYYSY